MTSRDELEELLERLEDHAKLHDDIVPMDEEQAQWANDLRKAAAAIRELLAQEPVAVPEKPEYYLKVTQPLYAAPVPAVSFDMEKFEGLRKLGWQPTVCPVCESETALGMPVLAVDLEAFKAEAMRLADVVARCYASRDIPTGVLYRNIAEKNWKDARAALAAHLDKLGGK